MDKMSSYVVTSNTDFLPIDIIRGKVNMVNMLWYVGFVGAFTIANYRIWHAGLKKYQSSN